MDFNGHVGEGNRSDEEVMGRFGVKERNFNRKILEDLAIGMKKDVVSTCF